MSPLNGTSFLRAGFEAVAARLHPSRISPDNQRTGVASSLASARNVACAGQFPTQDARLPLSSAQRAKAFVAAARSDNPSFSLFQKSSLEPLVKSLAKDHAFSKVIEAASSIPPEKWIKYPGAKAALLAGVPDAHRATLMCALDAVPRKQGYYLLPVVGDDSATLVVSTAAARLADGKKPYPVILFGSKDVARFKAGVAERHEKSGQILRELTARGLQGSAQHADWKAIHEASAPGRIPVINAEKSGMLRGLEPGRSKLYVEGHAGPDFDGLWFKRGDGGIVATNDEIARQLSQAGLRADFDDVRLYTCHSANAPSEGGPSNAERLAGALGRAGFRNAEVAGYPGVLRSMGTPFEDGKRHRAVLVGEHLTPIRASEARQKFRYNGNASPPAKPAP